MSDETNTDNDNVTSTVTDATENDADDGKSESETKNEEQPDENEANDLFDTIKESNIENNTSETNEDEFHDAIDGHEEEQASQEPMEVDEPVSDSQDNELTEPNKDAIESNNDEHEHEHESNYDEAKSSHDAEPDEQPNDVNDSVVKVDSTNDEVSEMEVDYEPSSQGEDVPDTSNANSEENVADKNSDEQASGPVGDASQDPFDSLMRDNDVSTSEAQNDSNAATNDVDQQNQDEGPQSDDERADAGSNNDDDNDDDDDEDDNNDNEGDNHDTGSHHSGINEAVDDLEEGKGADEELCLLPDEEREITDADKERALADQQAADNEDQENEANEVEDQETTEQTIEENGEKEPLDNQAEENEFPEPSQAGTTGLPFAPNLNEIREINFEQTQENPCLECGLVTKCKYTLLKEMPPNEDEPDSVAKNEVHFLCDSPCVNQFTEANAQYKLIVKKVAIHFVVDTEQTCRSCETIKMCRYRFKELVDSETFDYICEEECLNKFTESHSDKFVIAKKRFIVEETTSEVAETEQRCFQCSENLKCKYTFKQDDESFFLCQEPCVNLLMAEQPDRFRIKRQSIRVKVLPKRTASNAVATQPETRRAQQSTKDQGSKMIARTEDEARAAELDREASFCRRCAQCYTEVSLDERSLQWETLDFCNESCLGQYQSAIGAACQKCQNAVSVSSMGKYCVRFGFELRQFCRSGCLDAFKKGLKVCAYCQLDIAKNNEVLAKVNGQYKDFCSRKCVRSYEQIFSNKKPPVKTCAVCNNNKAVRVEVDIDSNILSFCSNPCFSAFKFVNNLNPDNCAMCLKYFERKSTNAHTIYQDDATKMFCSKICMTIFIITTREISPCQWCKVRKYNFDMIRKLAGPRASMMLCSLNCLQMCDVSMNAIAMKQQKCDQCNSMGTPQYHLTMSDASLRNFCTYQCVMSFQSQFSRAPLTLDESESRTQPVPTGLPKRIKSSQAQKAAKNTTVTPRIAQVSSLATAKQTPTSNNLVISNVTSLAQTTRSTRRSQQNANTSSSSLDRLQPVVALEPLGRDLLDKIPARPVGRPRNDASQQSSQQPSQASPQVRVETQTQIVTIPPLPKKIANAATMCSVETRNKEIQARPMQFTVGCQTDSWLEQKHVIPIPVPIYMPMPMNMWAQPFPVPVPIPLPIPVPIFIPTTRNSANGIMKEIKKIQDKMPADPFEAELLMMAEMVAGDKKTEDTDSSDDEPITQQYQPEENNFGDDMLQMALKMATEYDPQSVDLEASMQANTITPHTNPNMTGHGVMQQHPMMMMEDQRMTTRKRGAAPARQAKPPAKRGRRGAIQEPPPPQPEPEQVEKADANMYLKFTFGVNAWKQWVVTKNSELEKSSMRRKLFKTELLQLTADELNYSLCLFVKEVRKPNGSEYAPDTIYYLVLGIQEYLYENGRIDNIFTDPYYERFTDCLDDVARKFSILYNDSQYIVTRVEEEHLWECKQLGAHSPHVLLSTLMFFNTKYFNLTTVEEHMQLSFSHIMKHWKRNPSHGSAKVPGSRNVLLRFYPPQSANMDSRKKKVYEQQENEENPLRCPVKLYEFYLSKCPESVKTRNDVFYLLPERSCVPDSPVWYSTQALGKEALCKMLHRVKMVKEINIALLTS